MNQGYHLVMKRSGYINEVVKQTGEENTSSICNHCKIFRNIYGTPSHMQRHKIGRAVGRLSPLESCKGLVLPLPLSLILIFEKKCSENFLFKGSARIRSA